MIKLSRLADYSTVILHCLADVPNEQLSAKAIALKTHLTQPTVSKILKLLHEAGLVVSSRGVQGGYQLAKTPQNIRISEIVTAIDGKPALTECSSKQRSCAIDGNCHVRASWQQINRIVLAVLDSITLADLQKPINTQEMILHWQHKAKKSFHEGCV